MKTQDLFSQRDKTLYNLNRACSYFSRAIRENAAVLDSNVSTNNVTFLTESNKLYRCNFKESEDGVITLSNFKINAFDKVLSDKVIDDYLTSQVSDLVENVTEQNYSKAGYAWENVISIFEQKAEISKLSGIAREKLKVISEDSIKVSPAYKKLLENKELFIKEFTKIKDKVTKVEDIENALQISEAFNKLFTIERISDEKLLKEGFSVQPDQEYSLYEEVCRRETINNELRESKSNFKKVWMTNDTLKNLALAKYETDEDLPELLAESIRQIPFIALTSKTDLYDIFEAVNGLENTEKTKNDLREYASLIFELKKPARQMISEELKNKYGLNINTYKFYPSFENFAKVQSVLFEALTQVVETESVKQICEELSKDMVKKAGVGLIDVSDFMHQILTECKVDIGVYESNLNLETIGESASQVLLEYYSDDDTLETKKTKGKDKSPFNKIKAKDEKFNKGKEKSEEDGEEDTDSNQDGMETDKDNSEDPEKEKEEENPKFGKKDKKGKKDDKDKKDKEGKSKGKLNFFKKEKPVMKEEEDLDDNEIEDEGEDEDGDEDEISEYDPEFDPEDIQDILSDLDDEEDND